MPRREIDRLQGEIEELISDLWHVPRFLGLRHGFRPSVDCFQTTDTNVLTVVVELAGLDPDSIDVDLEERSLRSRASGAGPSRRPGLPADGDRVRPFERLLELTEDVDVAKTTASVRPRAADRHAPDRGAAGTAATGRDLDRARHLSTADVTGSTAHADMPAERPTVLPVLPLKETVVFPESMTPLAVGQERSIRLIDDVVVGDRMLALLTVKNTDAEQPGWDDVHEVGTRARSSTR